VVKQYYVPQVTELSEQELQSVFEAAEPLVVAVEAEVLQIFAVVVL
jgi:hypothetical protein